MTWKDGDEVNPGLAKKQTEEMLKDPKHQREKGSPDDLSTVDDPLDTEEDE